MYLSDATIKELVAEGRLGITPFDTSLVQPASVDCRLGPEIKQMLGDGPLDPRQAGDVEWVTTVMPDSAPFRLERGAFALGHTLETYSFPADILGIVDGKSSLGRIGLSIHVTAGFIDPGFHGQITLELANTGPRDVLIWPGMAIAQVSFASLDRAAERPYGSEGLGSRYQGQTGATSSRYSAGTAPQASRRGQRQPISVRDRE
jgi:dCTP deaminase